MDFIEYFNQKFRGELKIEDWIKTIGEFISNECGGIIRFVIFDSNNFGHQATGVNIIRDLIALFGPTKYLTNIELVYENGAGDQNKQRIKTLIPEWESGDSIIMGNVSICFCGVEEWTSVSLRPVFFGMTGGYDSGIEAAKQLTHDANVQYFLVLQPYQWPMLSAVWKDKSGIRLFIDNDVRYAQFATELPYYVRVPDKTQFGQFLKDEFQRKVILTVIDLVGNGNIDLQTIYGIDNPNATLMKFPPEHILFRMLSGIVDADIVNPTVVLVMQNPETDIMSKLVKLIEGTEATKKSIYVYNAKTFSEEIEKLKNLDKKIYVVFTGKVPQPVFSYMYYCATLPVIFEGKGTFSAILSFGKPYLVLNGDKKNFSSVRLRYGMEKTDSKSTDFYYYMIMGGFNQKCIESIYNCTLYLQNKPCSEEAKQQFIQYIQKVRAKHKTVFDYFEALKDFSGNPFNNKLLVGLMEAIRIIKPPKAKTEALLLSDPLEELYERMKAHIKDDTLALFPDCVSDKNIVNTYCTLLSLETVCINNVEILPKQESDKQFKVIGTVSALGELLGTEIVFRVQDNVIETEAEFRFEDLTEMMRDFGLFSFQDLKLRVSCSSDALSEDAWFGGTIDFAEKMELGFGFDYPVIEDTVTFSGSFPDHKLTMDSLFRFLGGINLADMLPSPFRSVADIGIEEIAVKYNYKTNTIYESDLTASVNLNWKLLPKLEFEKVKLLFSVSAPTDSQNRSYHAILTGDFNLGNDDDSAVLSAAVNLPDTSVQVELSDGKAALGDIVSLFMEQTIDLGAYLSDFKMEINSNDSSFSLQAGIEADKWSVKFTESFSLDLTKLFVHIEGNGAKTSGGISGTLHIGKEDGGIDLSMLAEFMPSGEGFLFQASTGQDERVDLLDLAETFLKALGGAGSVPDWVKESKLEVGNLKFSASTENDKKKYEAAGSVLWDLKYHSLSFAQMKADVKLGYNSENGTYGFVKGATSLLGMDINAGYEFSKTDQSLFIEWLGMRGSYQSGEKDEIITFTVKDKALGEIIDSLIQVFDSSFRLAPPWDFLNNINLDGISIKYHLKTKEVEAAYPNKINLEFLCFDSMTIVKNDKGVLLKAKGTFLGLPIESGDSGLDDGRDIRDLPKVPGQGSEIFELKYLGLGQHVALYPVEELKSVEEAVDALGNSFQEPKPVKNKEQPILPIPVKPEGQTPKPVLIWDGDSKWMVGAKFVVVNTIEIGMVFNDPSLYGLMVRISGEKLKIFNGLKFEILYKKISDTIGVYQMELQLPDNMRHLEFGAVSVTLPIVALEIYTNGNFRVDFGFPKNLDFSRSFTIQAFPFTGSGGFYFAMLNGETSKKVPETQYGSFRPVIEFGMGLSLGVGKDVSAGILKAGLSLTLVGILEGVLAFYHPFPPNDSGKDEVYYNIQGTLGITGKIYGEVNFAIIYARVDITFYAYIQITLEAYNSTPIEVEAGVSVNLTVKINLGLFKIKVSLSFSTKVHASFVIGQDQRALAPWNKKQNMIMTYAVSAPEYSLVFQPLLVTGKKKTLRISFMPHLTLADNGAAYVASLYIQKEDAGELIKGILLWCVNACINADKKNTTVDDVLNGTVTKEQLQYIQDVLTETDDTLVYHADGMDIYSFINHYFSFELSEPGGEADLEAGAFPMFPEFKMRLIYNGDEQTIDFGDISLCDKSYVEMVQKQIREMAIDLEEQESDAQLNAVRKETQIAMAELIFTDYIGMIAQNVLQAMLDVCAESQSVSKLSELLTDEDINRILGMTSRFMLSGLSLPSMREGESGKTVPLYELTGQLVRLPKLELGDDYEIMLFSEEKQENICFIGMHGQNTESVSIKLSDDEISRIQNLQGITLNPEMVEEPKAAPLYRDISRVYSLEKGIKWDSAIYFLPTPLQEMIKENPGTRLTLNSSKHGEIHDFTTAVLLNVEIRVIGQLNGTAYEIVGTDEQGIEILQKLLKYMKEKGSGFVQEYYFLYSPDQTNSKFVSQNPEDVTAAIVKTNLSTETNPADSVWYMENKVLNPAEEFLEQLWEASIVRTGGFYLYYHAKHAPEVFPDSIFDEYGCGTIKLLVTCQNTVQEFINCVLPMTNMAEENESFYILLPDVLERRAIVSPGNAGITLVRKNPGEYMPVESHLFSDSAECKTQDVVYMENQFQLIDYRIIGDDNFLSVESLSPAAPVDDPEHQGDWTYDFVVPLSKHMENGDPENPYSGIGRTAKVELGWKDIFGCRAGDRAKNYIVEIPLLYTDSLISFSKWPGITTDYHFTHNSRIEICFQFHYDSSKYVYTPGLSVEEVQQRLNYAQMDGLLYQKIRYQLEQDATAISMHNSMYLDKDGQQYMELPVDKQFFIDFVEQIQEYLVNCILYLESVIDGNPKQEYSQKMQDILDKIGTISMFSLEIRENNPSNLFELLTEIIVKRTDHVHDDFAKVEGVASVTNVIGPRTDGEPESGESTFRMFAEQFEGIFNTEKEDGVFFKLSVGVSEEGSQELWAVRFNSSGAGKGISCIISDKKYYFAPKPLSTKLLNLADVEISEYVSGQEFTLGGRTVRRSFYNIDLDMWTKTVLEAVDFVLSPDLAVPLYLCDKGVLLKRICDDKKRLAEYIASSMTNIMEGDRIAPDCLRIVSEKMKQRLLIRLADAYSVSTAVAMSVHTGDGTAEENSPKLYGSIHRQGEVKADHNYKFSSVKIPVQCQETWSTSLFEVSGQERQKSLHFDDLQYTITHMEHKIRKLFPDNAYLASDWLTFIVPFTFQKDKKNMNMDIPLPLRAYPESPSVLNQGYEYLTDKDGNLSEVRKYDYVFTYQHAEAAQDTINLWVYFNVSEQGEALQNSMNLPSAMAQFISVYPDIKNDLMKYLAGNEQPDDKAKNAAKAFSDIVSLVADSWNHVELQQMNMTQEELYKFEIVEMPEKEGIPQSKLIVTVSNSGNSTFPLPVLFLEGYETEACPQQEGSYVFYRMEDEEKVYLTYEEGMDVKERKVCFENLDILEKQNAWAGIYVTRNEHLIEGRETNPDFIYQTNLIKYGSKLVPLLRNRAEINIADVSGATEKKTLGEYLRTFFSLLLENADTSMFSIKISCRYSYRLYENTEPLTLPMYLTVPYLEEAEGGIKGLDTFIGQLANKIQNWFTRNQPIKEDGKIHFSIDLYAENSTYMPILTLENLVLYLEDIDF